MAQQGPTGYAFYEKVATDAGGNVAFAFIGLGVIWLCTKLWLAGARGLFWLAAGGMALSVAHFLIVTAAGAIASMRPILGHDRRWLWAGVAARFVEIIASLAALWLAARSVGYIT
jgi:hypothetical protein